MNNQETGEFECPVCFMLLDGPVTTQCGHTFCLKCITLSLQTVPKCPLCRYPLLYNSQYLRENTLIKSLIATQFPEHPKKQINSQSQNIDLKDSLPQNSLLGSRLGLLSSNNLFPSGKQRIFVEWKQFGGIHFDAIKQILNAAQVVVLKPNHELQSGENLSDIYGITGTVLSVNPQDNKIRIDLMTEDRVNINSIKKVQFKLLQQQQGLNEQQIEAPNQEVVFEMLTCSGQIILDDPININSPETTQQLKIILDKLVSFLKQSLNFNLNENQIDASTITVQTALQKTGLLNFLEDNALNTQESIRKFSLTLSGSLKLPIKEKQRMFQTTDVIERLILLNEAIKRYDGITNQLMIFDLDLPSHGANSLTTNLILLVGVVIALIIFNMQK